MKKNLLTLVVVVVAICGAHAFSYFQQHGIRGKVKPADAVEKVWAIQGQDSTKATPVEGSFLLTVRPGQYQIFVDAKSGFKDVVMENIRVDLGKSTDLGEIMIEKALP